MQLGNMTSGQTQLAILVASCAIIAWFYPEYTSTVIPLFVAITLYFSSDEMIVSMFSIIPMNTSSITDAIIKYKMYIMIALAVLSAYFANQVFGKSKKEELTETSSDLFGSSVPSTKYSAPKLSEEDSDLMELLKPKSKKLKY